MRAFLIVCFSIFIAAGNKLQAQIKLVTLPGDGVDSVLLLSTNKKPYYPITDADLKAFSPEHIKKLEAGNNMLMGKTFPLKDFSAYAKFYDIKKTIKQRTVVDSIVALFPKVKCATVRQYRCMPVYRDCAVFYKKGKPVLAIKICYECASVESTPVTGEARCLGEDVFLKPLEMRWIKLGLVNLFER